MTRFIVPGCLSLMLLFSAGCGGDDADPAANSKAAPKPRVAQVQPVNPATNKNKPAAKSKVGGAGKTDRNAASKSNLPPGVDPANIFTVSTKANEVEIAATAEQRKQFTVVAKPIPGADSSTFINPEILKQQEYQNRRVMRPRRTVNRGTGQRTLPEGFVEIEGSERAENGLPLRITCEQDGSEMVLIPAGTAIRGSNSGPEDTRPQHSVMLDDYYIAVHEVTLKQYEKFQDAVRGDNDFRTPRDALNASDPLDHPALGISQFDARNYAKWAKGHLPTEAQWEKAARGTEGFQYPWGDGRPVWPRHREINHIAPVMSFRVDVSTYGVWDMAGNAREWCRDIYLKDAYSAAGAQGEKVLEQPFVERKLTGGSPEWVIRGNGPGWKLYHRDHDKLTENDPTVGIRLALELPKEGEETEDGEESRDRRSTR